MSLEYRVGDVFDRLSEIENGSIDLIVTSPPFLALRSYLPSDHPQKAKEIGSESTPAGFIDTLLRLTAEFGRVLAPHGSLCVELGDTYSGSGGAGGDYNADGLRDGAPKFDGSAKRTRKGDVSPDGSTGYYTGRQLRPFGLNGGNGWPLAKSLTGIPTLYPWSLAYGRNLLTGADSPAGLWRIRNIIVWARPNPPVGALGDKFRPATSYITIACRGARRFFDLDAVRQITDRHADDVANGRTKHGGFGHDDARNHNHGRDEYTNAGNPAGAPPLDWHTDLEDGDWLWKLSTQPFRGAHYATFPLELPTRLIKAMCPLRVCITCGKPSERITGDTEYVDVPNRPLRDEDARRYGSIDGKRHNDHRATRHDHLGWSDCDCLCYSCRNGGCPDCSHKWRTGVVLDPFCGSGTTLQAAQNVGRHAIGIDLDPRNADLARSRCGMFLEVVP